MKFSIALRYVPISFSILIFTDKGKTSALNKHLANYMPGLTAKVFRTYNASYTMGCVLNEMNATGGTIAEKVKAYNDANRKVAILCNHKRTVTAGHANAMEKMSERVSFMHSTSMARPELIDSQSNRSRDFVIRSGG